MSCRRCTKSVGKTRTRYASLPQQIRYTNYTSDYSSNPRKLSPYGYDPGCMPSDGTYECSYVDPKYCPCPIETDSGILQTIRSRFQQIFTGRKKCCEPQYRDRMYRYSLSELKCLEQIIDKLEDDTYCVESAIREAYECDCRINCNNLRCSLSTVSGRIDEIKGELSCALECYDPCNQCEYDLTCLLLERACCLETLITDLCLELDCLEFKGNCYQRNVCRVKRPVCKPGCKKVCCQPKACYPKGCFTGCKKPCCVKPCRKLYCKAPCEGDCSNGCYPTDKACCVPRKCRKDLCSTASAIPVGVMLVKL